MLNMCHVLCVNRRIKELKIAYCLRRMIFAHHPDESVFLLERCWIVPHRIYVSVFHQNEIAPLALCFGNAAELLCAKTKTSLRRWRESQGKSGVSGQGGNLAPGNYCQWHSLI